MTSVIYALVFCIPVNGEAACALTSTPFMQTEEACEGARFREAKRITDPHMKTRPSIESMRTYRCVKGEIATWTPTKWSGND